MTRQRSKKLSANRKSAYNSITEVQDDLDEAGYDSEGVEVAEIDEDENELEKLVLGDEAGFMAEIGREMIENDDLDSQEEYMAELELPEDKENLEEVDDAELFFLDDGPSTIENGALIQGVSAEEKKSSGPVPAWEDSDDERLIISLAGDPRLRKLRTTEAEDLVNGKEYVKRLRRQFQRLKPAPEWASCEKPTKRRRRSSASSGFSDSSNDMDIDDEDISTLPLARLLQNAGSLAKTDPAKQPKLRPEIINIQRSKDIPLTQPSAVTSLSFHPQYPVILSSGPASTLYLHHISPGSLPTPNPLLTSVHIRSTPLHTSAFLPPNGDKIFFSGRRRFFHTWDLESGEIEKVTRVYGHQNEQRSMERFKLSPCGRYMGLIGSARKGGGVVNILDANTSQWIASARIEGKGGVADFAWWGDGQGMTIAGKGGEIGEWDVKTQSFTALWTDEGAVGITVIALGGRSGRTELGGDRWVVIGSSSGVINIYDRRPWTEKGIAVPHRPEPKKRFMQLTTPTSFLEISRDGQLLAFASRWKKDALRLVHLPSCAVYRNWPTDQTPLGRITAVAFSSERDMLAVGNEQGKIRLWDIRV